MLRAEQANTGLLGATATGQDEDVQLIRRSDIRELSSLKKQKVISLTFPACSVDRRTLEFFTL